jgi:hypothetical protein
MAAQAGLLPKILKQVPAELQGEYVLLTKYVLLPKMNPEKTQEGFTNPPPFATILSNTVVLASGTVRPVESVIHVSQKGTNVHLVSFGGKASWLISPGPSPSTLLVLEPIPDKPKQATVFVIGRKPATPTQTNALPDNTRARMF